jgi:hypothetical protein
MEGQKSNVWESELVKEDYSSAMSDDCEAQIKFHSHKTGLQIGLWHVKGTVAFCLDVLNGN